MTSMPHRLPTLPTRFAGMGLIALAVSLLLPALSGHAVEGKWSGKLNCSDGWGNPLNLQVDGQASGSEIQIKIGDTSLRRPIDGSGAFTVGISVGKAEQVAHLRGTIGAQNLTLSSSGGEAVCSASIPAAAPAATQTAVVPPGPTPPPPPSPASPAKAADIVEAKPPAPVDPPQPRPSSTGPSPIGPSSSGSAQAAGPAPAPAAPFAPPAKPIESSPVMLAQAEPVVARASSRVADVIELLQRERANAPARLKAARGVADAPEPQNAKPAERADFLARRAFAAWALDREDQARADFRRAYDIARAERTLPALDRTWFQYHFGLALFRGGDLQTAMQHLRESIAELRQDAASKSGEDQRKLLWHIIVWEGFLSNAHVATGNIEAAQKALADAEQGFASLTSAPTPAHERALAEAAVAQARAAIATLRGRPQEADEQHRIAIRALATHPSWPKNRWLPAERVEQIKLEAVLARAKALADSGRSDEAVALARQVVAQLAEGPAGRPAETASAARVLAETLSAQGRPEDAAPLAALALDVLAQAAPTRGTPLRIELYSALALSQAAAGRWAESRDAYEKLRGELGPDRTRFQRAVGADPTYALALLRTGQLGPAREAAETAQAQARLLYGPRDPRTAEAGAAIAAVMAEAGQREAALGAFRASMPTLIAAAVDAGGFDAPARASRLRVLAEAYMHALAQAIGAGPQGVQIDGPQLDQAEEMLRTAEAARSRRLLESIAQSVERSGLNDPQLADLVRREQDAGRRIKALYDSLAGLYALPASERGRQDQVLRQQIGEVEADRGALRRQIAQRRPALAQISRPSPPTVAELRQALKPEEALVAMFVGDRRSYAFALPKQGALSVVEAPIGSDKVTDAVVLVRSAMLAEGSIERMPAFDAAAAHDQLYAPLLKPLESSFAGAQELVVVPDGALTQVPIGMLPTAPVPASGKQTGDIRFAEYADVPWLIRRQAVVHLPSATAFTALRRAAATARPQRPFIGFGDPVFAADATAGGQRGKRTQTAQAQTTGTTTMRAAVPRNAAVRNGGARAAPVRAGVPRAPSRGELIEAVESLPALPDTRAELQEIAKELGADANTELFLGRRASEAQVRRARLDRYRVIAFATHGLAPGDIDGLVQPALALSSPRVTGGDGDGLLTMAEVLELRLAADWVVLSACNTAGAAEPGADMLSGLASAFFYAGARSLLVTHWAVETVSARLMTTGTFAAKDASRAQALRQAMLSLIDGKAGQGNEGGKRFSYAHPVFWAPFALVGDAG